MPSIESYRLLLAAAAACEDKKAEDIRILALDPNESGLSDYFLICNGTNDRQNVAITDEIEIRLKRDFNVYPNSVEGRRQGEWVLMDYVDFIVHVFSAEKRAYYGLERLRKSAVTVSVAELGAELKGATEEKLAASRDGEERGKKRVAKKAVKAVKAVEATDSAGPEEKPVRAKAAKKVSAVRAGARTALKTPVKRRATPKRTE